MWSLLRNLLNFRIGQKTARGLGHLLGMNRLGVMIIGLIGGYRFMRRHAH